MEGYSQYRRLVEAVTTPNKLGSQTSLSSDSALEKSENNGEFDVTFGEGDVHDPKQWSKGWKLLYIGIIWWLVFFAGWSSAADSTSHDTADRFLHVSQVAESLATANFLWGVAAGALIAGPLSETVGRLPTYLATYAGFLIWVMASALAPNFGAQITFRFFAGFFSSASMSIYGGSMADLFEPEERASIWPVFALSPLLGPTIAPIASGWIVEKLGWRWVDWMTLILAGWAFAVAFCCLPETLSPVILSYKASILRKTTGDDRFESDFDRQEGLSVRLGNNLKRIVYFVAVELTTVLFSLYLTLLYLLIFGFLEGFDFIFSDTYHFGIGHRYSAFAAVAVGMVVGLPYVLLVKWVARSKQSAEPGPEQRLTPSLLAAPLLAGSLFWLGWTNFATISFWSDLIACCVFGFSVYVLFTSTYHYLLDTYGSVASSAMAAATFTRYMASGGMIMATEPMYDAIGVQWSLTIFGCVAAALVPVPWLFWWYGEIIRKRSKWASSD